MPMQMNEIQKCVKKVRLTMFKGQRNLMEHPDLLLELLKGIRIITETGDLGNRTGWEKIWFLKC